MIYQNQRIYLPIIVLLIALIGCVPRQDNSFDILLDVYDPGFMNVVDAEVNQDKIGLLSHLSEPDPGLRYKAIMAYASFTDSTATDSIISLLQDPMRDIRAAAAYTLGQMGDSKVIPDLQNAFIQKDTGSIDLWLNHNILEAMGKIGSATELDQLASISTYRDKDTNLLLGQARSIYRFALRGITSQKGTDQMVNVVLNPNIDNKVRLVAAHYLMRAKEIDIFSTKHQLLSQLRKEQNVDIKMALAKAMGKVNDPELVDPLIDVYGEATDYRVKTNLLRSMQSYDSDSIRSLVFNALSDDNIHISNTAADHLIEAGRPEDVPMYRQYLNSPFRPQIKAKLIQAVLVNVSPYYTKTREFISYRAIQEYTNATDDNTKRAYIKALSSDVRNYQKICDLLINEESPVLQSELMQGLASITQNPNFSVSFRTPPDRQYALRYIARTIEATIRKGDLGAMAIAGGILGDQNLNLKDVGRLDFTYIDTMRQAISLPEGLEAYNALIPAQNFLLDTTLTAYTSPMSQKINWTDLQTLGDSSYVKIKTSRGDIDFTLYTKESPATVANFIRLANENFYDNKNFHRVVSNFVIQGGCTRGDGYGSPGFTIRSEFGPLYYDSEGIIGMASAGPHTESAQFFITHSPAMHLDGKYTIFGKVTKGMDVVHAIQEGDIIEDVQIRND